METKTFETELFIHKSRHGLSGYAVTQHSMEDSGYLLLGTQTVTLDVPESVLTIAELDLLEDELTEELQIKVRSIRSRKEQLADSFSPGDILSTLNTSVNE
ncbi:MAG: hypothetical protein HRU18_23505 [Pseudoalteromonas sp.]|uniref:hypothetical protein n=1 Tax=Pseudoalteromonas sp. TaxID=53249 RepID=UPI001D79B616|nr:hypothetical protein [Pseudoalteromonas sp.]NRA81177.1 hypothetical protein [Pseudoalteromonas sp.]